MVARSWVTGRNWTVAEPFSGEIMAPVWVNSLFPEEYPSNMSQSCVELAL